MKTPDEIKKGLECCTADVNGFADCWHCPYSNDSFTVCVGEQMAADALTYINDLEAAHRTEYYENADYDCITLRKARKRVETLEAKVAELETENELTLKRLQHLLKSDFIQSFDEYDPKHQTYKRNIVEADTIVRIPKWVSVEDKLPEDDVDVLVYALDNNKSSVIAMTSYTRHMHGYNIEGWCSPWQYFFCNYKITHWMPTPEGPKEE